MDKKYDNITLILAGGGMKAFSYIGFLDVLKENNLLNRINLVGACSGGSIVGCAYFLGKKYDEIKRIVEGLSIWKLIDISIFTDRALFSNRKIDSMLSKLYDGKTFDDLEKDLIIFTTNISKKRLEYFDEGELKKYIRASMAISPMVSGININGDEHIDPGFLTVFPSSIMREMASDNLILGLYPAKGYRMFPESILSRAKYLELVLEKGIELMIHDDPPDLAIETLAEDKGHIFDFSLIDDFYEQGRKAAQEQLDLIKSKLS